MFKADFSYEKRIEKSLLILAFKGDMDKLALTEFKLEINKVINEFKGKKVVFDFTELNYINSEAIGYLMQVNGFLLSVDKQLILVGVKKNIKDILDAIGIYEIIPVFNNLKDFLN